MAINFSILPQVSLQLLNVIANLINKVKCDQLAFIPSIAYNVCLQRFYAEVHVDVHPCDDSQLGDAGLCLKRFEQNGFIVRGDRFKVIIHRVLDNRDYK